MNRENALLFSVRTHSKWEDFTNLDYCGWSFQDNKLVHTIHDPITIDDWNRAKIVPNTKVRIESPEHSEYLQKLAFEAGFEWRHGHDGNTKNFNMSGLFINVSKITPASGMQEFNEKPSKEIFIEMPEPNINARVLAEKVGSKHNAVHSPKHYEVIEGVEAIELIASSLTLEQWKGYCLGSIMKYRLRAGKKDALQQDIDKANEYEMLYSKYADRGCNMTTINDQIKNEVSCICNDNIDWSERYAEAYPEDSPIMHELSKLKSMPQNAPLSNEEKICVIKHYQRHGKLKTLKQFDTLSCAQLKELKKEFNIA